MSKPKLKAQDKPQATTAAEGVAQQSAPRTAAEQQSATTAAAEQQSASSTAPDPKCGTCPYNQTIPSGKLRCRRFPPQVVSGRENSQVSSWPIVDENDYCGEHPVMVENELTMMTSAELHEQTSTA